MRFVFYQLVTMSIVPKDRHYVLGKLTKMSFVFIRIRSFEEQLNQCHVNWNSLVEI